jgi:hypothetical protein
MGLFDLFTHEGRLKRHALRVANRDAQPEDREASWRWLAEDASKSRCDIGCHARRTSPSACA